MGAEGSPDDILVVSDYPGEEERKLGIPMVGKAGKLLRKILSEIAPNRNVVFHNAINCSLPGGFEDHESAVEACRGYVADVLVEANPSVVLVMGSWAGLSVLGRTYSPLSVRKGYGWIRRNDGVVVPAFLLMNPAAAARNRLMEKALREDIAWALSNPPLNESVLSAEYNIVEDEYDAALAWERFSRSHEKGILLATDTETSGRMFSPDFRVDLVSVTDGGETYVYPRRVFANDPMVMAYLCMVLSLLDHTSWNGQYDYCAIQSDPVFVPVRDPRYRKLDGLCTDDSRGVLNIVSDARVKRKLYESDTDASLGTAAELVGMGGHKLQAQSVVAEISDDLDKYAKSFQLTPTGKKRVWKGSKHFQASDVPPVWVEYLHGGMEPEAFAHRFVPEDIEARYNAADALATWHLENWAVERMASFEDSGLLTIWDEVCQTTMWAYCRMRENGVPISRSGVEAFRLLLETEMAMALRAIHTQEPNLNPLSNPQVVELMKKLGISPKRKTTSGGISASKEVLAEFADKHRIIKQILTYRTLQKIHGTYAVGIAVWIVDDLVHPSILQSGTETGRPSSADPNLLNVVKGRDEETRKIASMFRNCFVAPHGHSIIEADEKQIEIRAAADFSGDPQMVNTIVSGVDFHKASAEKFAAAMGVDYLKLSDDEKDLLRERSKTTNFAAVYEIPCELPFMLQSRLKISRKDAEALGKSIFAAFVRLREWMDETYASACATGYTRTHWKGKPARRRPLWGLGYNPATLPELEKLLSVSKFGGGSQNSSSVDKSDARATYNTDVQGGAVDIVSSMLWRVQRWLDANTNGGKAVLHVYDSIMCIVRDEDVEKTCVFLSALMCDKIEPRQGYTRHVPLGVDVKVGKTWSTLTKWSPGSTASTTQATGPTTGMAPR